METPSSTTRRVTRSQAKSAASANNNIPMSKRFEESELKSTKSGQRNGGKQKERSALIDITNDSPIIGLAMGTPSSMVSRKRAMITPGSGEALLRGQVKNLLQKVEEEADICKLSLGKNRPFLHLHQGFGKSPMHLLAPTPANTPHLNPSENGLPSVTPTPVEEKFIVSQMIITGKKEDSESEQSKVTRSLLLEFSEKLDGSDSSECSSMVTYESVIAGGESGSKDDASSVWSIQANASSTIDEEDEDDDECLEESEEECDYGEEEGVGESVGGLLLEELCEGMSKISFNGDGSKFAGKHTRFVYNSDGEIEGVEEEEDTAGGGGGVLVLKGLPPPEGKHIRFPEEEEEI